jgi:hypothetical protein
MPVFESWIFFIIHKSFPLPTLTNPQLSTKSIAMLIELFNQSSDMMAQFPMNKLS